MAEKIVQFQTMEDIVAIFGSYDENIELLQKEFNVTITNRDENLKISGEPDAITMTARAIDALMDMVKGNETITDQSIRYIISLVKENMVEKAKALSSDCVCITAGGKPIRAKTLGQKKYLDAIKNNIITLGVGPAGTGKTYLAVAMAVRAFRAQEITRIILTRPAVEAGEKLGFLPGDLQTKVDPYLRPLYDALFDMFGAEAFTRQLERGIIEVAPLAYMRGRTLDDSFIILDEAQNTTREQMKMFLTRLGANSRAVITGDVTQIDLPDARKSGLIDAVKVLQDVEEIETVFLNEKDVVRNRIVQQIVKAYSKYESEVYENNHGQSKSID
ncbi:MAG: PhoH family protein [Oscillospiraceae bacterium]